MYRIYDHSRHCFRDDMLILPDGALAICEKKMFGRYRLNIIWDEVSYTLHFDTGIYDKNKHVIFEGDICKDKDGNEYVVGYGREVGAYCLFDYDNDLYYILVDEVGKDVEVVGNVLEGVVSSDEDS